jgi:hypothetical protein
MAEDAEGGGRVMKMRDIINLCEGSQPPKNDFWTWFGRSKIVDDNGKPMIVFHQTSKENADGITQNGFDLTRIGARGTDEQMPDGIFFKPTDAAIGSLGSGKDVVQLAYYLSIQSPLVVEDRDALSAFLMTDPSYAAAVKPYKDIETQREQDYSEIEDRFDAHWPPREGSQGSLPGYHEACEAMNARYDALIPEIAAKARACATQALIARGHDGLVVSNDVGMFGRSLKTIVAFRSDQVRKVPDHRVELDRRNRIAVSWGRTPAPDDGNYD